RDYLKSIVQFFSDYEESVEGQLIAKELQQPGDVYWDLFRVGNQNRSSGNREALWVIQYETDMPGGVLSSAGGYGHFHTLERVAGPASWLTLKDPDGEEGVIGVPMSDYNTGGAGVSL